MSTRIQVVENFLLQSYLQDLSVCDKLIEKFKNSPDKHIGRIGSGVNEKIKESTDCEVYTHEILTDPVVADYFKQLQVVCDEYIEKYPMCNSQCAWRVTNTVNLQHYSPKQAYYGWHAERSGYDDVDSKRHLVFMTYLNDVYDQGETEFYHQNLKVQPRKGLTLIWPTDWTYLHRGIASPTQEKYIITGWYTYYR